MDVIPLLLPLGDASAKDILALLGACAPAKEVIIAVQEGMERLERAYADESDEEDDDDETKTLSVPAQLNVLIGLYASCMFFPHFLGR